MARSKVQLDFLGSFLFRPLKTTENPRAKSGQEDSGLTAWCAEAAKSLALSELARKVGMSREGLYKALSEDGNPSYATIVKVAKALGLKIEFHAVA